MTNTDNNTKPDEGFKKFPIITSLKQIGGAVFLCAMLIFTFYGMDFLSSFNNILQNGFFWFSFFSVSGANCRLTLQKQALLLAPRQVLTRCHLDSWLMLARGSSRGGAKVNPCISSVYQQLAPFPPMQATYCRRGVSAAAGQLPAFAA